MAAALFLGRSLRADEPRWLAGWIHRAVCRLRGGDRRQPAGRVGWVFRRLLGDWWFWLGNQGWEYLELGRFWQYLLVVGFAGRGLRCCGGWRGPRTVTEPAAQPLARMFLLAALAIPVFYMPALFFGAKTNYTVVDTWRFWIIHLWVEGFFEFFATTVVALTFYPARPDPPQRGAAGDLSGRHPVLPRRPDRHRPPLVFHRPYQLQHGDVGDVLGAGSGAADLADAGRLGLRSHDTRRLRCLRQVDRRSRTSGRSIS